MTTDGVNIDRAHGPRRESLDDLVANVETALAMAGRYLAKLRQRVDELRDAAVSPIAAPVSPAPAPVPAPAPIVPPVATPAPAPKRGALSFEYQGRQCTVKELAAVAGCSYFVMHSRLRMHSAEDAVAMGGAVSHKTRVKAAPPAPPPPPPPPAAPRSAFEYRTPPAPPPAQAGPRVSPRVDEFRRDVLAPGSKLDLVKRGDLVASDAEPVIPPGVKRTVAAPAPDPRAAGPAPSTFGRIGQYIDADTHIGRVYGSRT